MVEWFMTPSKRIVTVLPWAEAGMERFFRYHAVPQGRNAVQLASVGSKGASTLQSCGRSSGRQVVSLKAGSRAAGLSDLENFQLSLSRRSRVLPAGRAKCEVGAKNWVLQAG